MRKLILAVCLGVAVTWLLLFANEVTNTTGSLLGEVVYIMALLCPSGCFWLFAWASKRLPGQSSSDHSVPVAFTTVALVAASCGIAYVALPRPSAERTAPALSSAVTAAYACSLALVVAILIRLPGVKRQILQGNLLGRLALGVALGGLIGFLVAKFLAWQLVSRLGVFSSLVLDSWCLVALLLAFLCLLSAVRAQRFLGVISLVAVLFLFVFSHFEVFFSIWLVGFLFWPFVVLCALITEAAAFRKLLPRLLVQVLFG